MSGFLQAMVGLMTGAPGVINQSLPDAAATDPAGAGITIANTGVYTYGDTLGNTNNVNWVTPTGLASLYQFQVNITSGALASGTVDTWIDGSTGGSYSTSAGAGAQTTVLRVRIREKATGIVRADQSVSLVVSE